ncbi:MAG: GDSL-type esterase/lipase family protein [Vicinamibacterales bacterium]
MSASPDRGARVSAVVALAVLIATAGCSETPVAPRPTPGAPALACPANIVIPGVQTGSEEVVYPKPVLTGGQAPIVSSCAPTQGSSFPLGATVVTCTTTDARQQTASCAFSVTVTRSVLAAKRFLAFGDSITAGENGLAAALTIQTVEKETSYPTVLKSLLDAEYPNQGITVVNAGVGGEKITCLPDPPCGVERLPDEIALHQPDALLLLDGYNDLNNAGDVVTRVVDGLREAIRLAQKAGVKYVFVSTLTPGRDATGPRDRERDEDLIIAANEDIRNMVPAEGAYLVDAFAAFLGREQALVNTDGLHLTVEGYQVLAQTFFARIREVIPDPQQLQGGPGK